ncbi:MAG: cytidylate kinase-like family protein [Oscillospiraceae bacterium]|nr:cytidylate kinase-like family protein [Oscillospiraceae bacterium]
MIITIGRQHGTNGKTIAVELSKKLGIPCYSREIVDEAAKNSNFSKEVLDSYDEKRVSPYVLTTPDYPSFNETFHMNIEVVSVQFDAIRTLAEKGDCIFVGRCADYILRNSDDLVRVFIYGDYSNRVKNIMQRKDLTEDKAKKLIKEVDKDRASYYRYYTDQIWGDLDNYDLCVDSTRTGIEGTVAVIKAFIDNL